VSDHPSLSNAVIQNDDDQISSQKSPPLSPNGLVALDLAQHGFYVFPCQSKVGCDGDKTPLISSWRESSTYDPELISQWWRRHPHALIAIDCGKSDIIVIDADRHSEEVDGVANLQEILGSDLAIVGCPIVETAGNGLHLYFAQPHQDRFRNSRGALPPGIDVRGDGGYIIAPGSARLLGAGWVQRISSPDLLEAKAASTLPQLPEKLFRRIRKLNASTIRSPEAVRVEKFNQFTSSGTGSRAYALVALKEETNRLTNASRGTRNITLNSVAFRLGSFVARDWLSRAEVESALKQACLLNGLSKESPTEVQRTISSGLLAGINTPHSDLPALKSIEQRSSAIFTDQEETTKNIGDHTKYSTANEGLLKGFIFDGDIPPKAPPQLVRKLIPQQGICFIGGQSGAGKTFVAIDLAVSLASGTSFFSHQTLERVGVVILAAEGAHTLASRIQVARDQKASGNFLPIAWQADVPNLADNRRIRDLIARLGAVDVKFRKDHGVRLGAVICDTLAACFAIEDENDNSKAAAVIRYLKELSDRLNIVVIPIHHYGKSAETGLRGASAWRAGSDVVLSVLADRDQVTGKCNNRRLTLAKSRSESEGWQGAFKLTFVPTGNNEDDEETGACYVELCSNDNADQQEKHKKLSSDAKAYCQSLGALLGDKGEKIRPYGSEGPEVIAVNREDIRQEFYRARPADGDDEKKINEARRKAFKRGEDQACGYHLIKTYQLGDQHRVWFLNNEGDNPFMARPDCGTGGTQGL